MFTLIAILTVLQLGNHSTFKVLSPFDNEQLCQERAPELVKYVVMLLPERNLIAEDVTIETKCVSWGGPDDPPPIIGSPFIHRNKP
jgi:hypothetical protein